MFEKAKRRIDALKKAPVDAPRAAAPRIQAKLRSDATTARGNVPSFGKFGDIPISARVRAGGVVVTAADWVLDKAKDEGQPKEWAGIVRDEVRKAARGSR